MPLSYPRAHRPDVPAHRGFLSFNRRLLAAGALASTGALMCIPALPASADFVAKEVEVSLLQTYVAPSVVPMPVVSRDGFDITEYTLVQWPVPASTTMSSAYGFRSCSGCSSDHKGIDLNPGNGYPVESIADGVVVLAEESDAGLGVQVVIEHVIDGQVVRTVYGHLQFGSLGVATGDTVTMGQQIGLVGSTGASTGAHLHFEVIINDEQVDPLPWITEHANSLFSDSTSTVRAW